MVWPLGKGRAPRPRPSAKGPALPEPPARPLAEDACAWPEAQGPAGAAGHALRGRVAALTAGPRLGGCRRQRQLGLWAGRGWAWLWSSWALLAAHPSATEPWPALTPGAPREGHQPGYLYINPWVCYDSRGLCPGRAGADGCGVRGGRGPWCQVWELGAVSHHRMPCPVPPLCQPHPPWEFIGAKPRGREELRPGGASCPLPLGDAAAELGERVWVLPALWEPGGGVTTWTGPSRRGGLSAAEAASLGPVSGCPAGGVGAGVCVGDV